MADKSHWRTIELPTGATFRYNPEDDFDTIVDDYNRIKHAEDPEKYPKINVGGTWKDRFTMSGQDQKSIQETLRSRHSWSAEMPTSINEEWSRQVKGGDGIFNPVLGAVGGGGVTEEKMKGRIQNMYFDPEANELITLDEPGLSMKDLIADPARGAAQLTGEIAGTLVPTKRAKAAGKVLKPVVDTLKTGGKGAAGSEIAGQLYDRAASFFGGLKEGRSIVEQGVDMATDAATVFFGEGIGRGVSGAVRGRAAKAGRGSRPLDDVAADLEDYKFTFGEPPQSRGTLVGPGSIQTAEDDLIARFPNQTNKLQAAVRGTDGVIRRRLDQITDDIHPDEFRPGEVATAVRQDFMGENVPFGAVDDQGVPIPGAGTKRASEGGWVEVGQANIDKKLAQLRETFPSSTLLREAPPQAPPPYRPPGSPLESTVPGNILNSPETIATEAARKQEASFPFNVAPSGTKAPPTEPVPPLPLETAVNALVKDGETGELITLAQNVLSNPDATLDDLLNLQRKIGARGGGQTGVPADMATRLYGATKESVRQLMADNPEALRLQAEYDKLAEEYYTKVQGELPKIFEAVGGSRDPGASFAKLNTLTTGFGKPGLLAELFGSISPDSGDLLRKSYLTHLFNKSPKAALNAYRKWSPEVKDMIVGRPNEPGGYRRRVYDSMANMTDEHAESSMKLLNRQSASASVTKREGALQSRAIWDAASRLGTGATIVGAVTGHVPPEVAGGVVVLNGARFLKDVVGDFAARLAANGRAELLMSPAYMDFVTTATKFDPGDMGSTEAAIDALISLTPRAAAIGYQELGTQDMRDIQNLQSEWLSMIDASTRNMPQPTEDGILGPDARPPAAPEGLFSTTFTETARR